eukprot:6176432-Pleurochrysis_carterae.AAC.6
MTFSSSRTSNEDISLPKSPIEVSLVGFNHTLARTGRARCEVGAKEAEFAPNADGMGARAAGCQLPGQSSSQISGHFLGQFPGQQPGETFGQHPGKSASQLFGHFPGQFPGQPPGELAKDVPSQSGNGMDDDDSVHGLRDPKSLSHCDGQNEKETEMVLFMNEIEDLSNGADASEQEPLFFWTPQEALAATVPPSNDAYDDLVRSASHRTNTSIGTSTTMTCTSACASSRAQSSANSCSDVRANSCSNSRPPPPPGVRISWLRQFCARHVSPGMSCEDVFTNIIRPRIVVAKCSFIQLVPAHHVGPTTVYCIHARNAPFCDLVAAASHVCSDETCVWIDLFAINPPDKRLAPEPQARART